MLEMPEHDLATCVRCGLCLQACPTFVLSGVEGYSARGRIGVLRMVSSGVVEPHDRVVGEFLDTCLGCRACEAACPSGVPYGRILEHARAELPRPGGPLRRLTESVALWTLARPWRLVAASLVLYPLQKLGLLRLAAWLARHRLAPRVLENAAGIPRLRMRTLLVRMATNYAPLGEEWGQVVLFAGCVQDAWAREVHWATITALTRAGYRVRVPHGQVCCGALAAHGGRLAAARRLARRNLGPLERYEGRIVVDAAGCGAKLKEYGELVPGDERAARIARRARDVSEVLSADRVRRTGARPPDGLRRVAVHDPCHLAFAQGVREQPRALLRAAGYEVVDLPDSGRCCGAAGSFALTHPGWARPLRDAKLDACLSVAPDAVAVANPGCLFWMSSAAGAPRMFHPIQLVAMAMVNAPHDAGAGESHARGEWLGGEDGSAPLPSR